ncbi:IucA/IucC family C-terminal-domain containing protein [Paenibacillus sp. EPM92]|uniref:IucA/IucC family C-terminal-domain containing protein n=1 Tax=Paenibacillus sp. EPM92 TaxID=1561195 RepID=UPI0019150740|nr:IucA/IucC family C-terminal-domain containing protein [Paenibacillus sp. EPM92]
MDFLTLEQKYHIRREDPEHLICSIPAAELLERPNMQQFLELYGTRIHALEPAACAAYFSGWLGYAAFAQQYALSFHNQALDLSLSNFVVQLHVKESYTAISFKLVREAAQPAPAGEAERTAWLRRTLTELYGTTFRPLLEAASEAAGIEVGQLWGQFPTKLNYLMDDLLAEAEEHELRERIAEDYNRLRQELNSEVFGRAKNPLDVKIRWMEDLKDPDKRIRMKNACCLYYRTEGGFCCYTCPRLTEEQREERRTQARKTAIAQGS